MLRPCAFKQRMDGGYEDGRIFAATSAVTNQVPLLIIKHQLYRRVKPSRGLLSHPQQHLSPGKALPVQMRFRSQTGWP